MREVTFSADTDGVTVERFVRRLGVSHHLLTILKAAPDGMTVEGAPVRTIDRLHKGDRLTLRISETAPSETIVPVPMPLSILYEDEDLFLLDKPAGMAVHPSQGNRETTAANALAALYRQRGEPFVFRAIGRLDKNTSGILLLAKNALSACLLTAQAARGELHRAYLAVCSGELPLSGTIDAPIARAGHSVLLREIRPDGKPAVTHFKRLCFRNGVSLARILPETGRTHQIRIHFASIGHPLVGDFLYGQALPGLNRHALHRFSMDLVQPVTKKPLRFTAPLPPELAALLQDKPSAQAVPEIGRNG